MDLTHERTLPVDDVDSLVPEPSSTKTSQLEEVMNQELLRGGGILTKVELDLAFCSEKLVNLSVLMMHLGTMESDFEAFASEKEPSGVDSAGKAMEFDLLSVILDSEVNDLEKLIQHLQTETQSVRDMISPFQEVEEAFPEMIEKLCNAEQALQQSLDQILEMKMQSAKFQRISSGLDGVGTWSGGQVGEFQYDGEFGDMSSKIKMLTADQQRNFLRMLEKSLGKEMELEKKLTESRQTEKELRVELYSSEQNVFYMEEEAQEAYSRWFEAENAAEVFKGISKELLGKLQILQFNLNGYFKRENDLKSELIGSKEQLEAKESALQKLDSSNARVNGFLAAQAEGLKECLRETEDKLILLDSENMTLRETISSLEEQLKERELQAKDLGCESQRQDSVSSATQLRDLEHAVEDLKDRLTIAEARAEDAESKCKQVDQNNKELTDELEPFKAKGFTAEKLESVEKRLRDSDIQLKHAIAAGEASEEKQNMLYSTVFDMENVIEDLKLKVTRADLGCESQRQDSASSATQLRDLEHAIEDLKDRLTIAEARAEDAESKCKQVDQNNKELTDELEPFKAKGFTAEKLESVEKRLRDSDIQLKHAIAAVEASQEKQNMLYSTVFDMENVIEDLKLKVTRADYRADSVEDKLIAVSESNAELNEELSYLRGRLKELEELKTRTAKDIGVRNKIMKNLVMQLAVERERLHQQISTLSVENSVLVMKLKQRGKPCSAVNGNGFTQSKKDGFSPKPEQSGESRHRESRSRVTVTTSATSSEEEGSKGSAVSETESKSETSDVRRVDAGALGMKHILTAILLLILSAAAYSILQPDPAF
ncbi:PREDICTED: WPP domain-interacting tail-anchored protein 1-like isoform X1 [Tarenaya hassleriana]|uniref:WPP domain-interacting tail-anchored protein 1-like isoform X1 n=2 Tax=Tarenaya hassleriana TaxID=28532 RepID=UPI00053C8B98|nr:PREDICTED: WPP domain-interacting tail-anchored protein 1-like isoform X1 [Tarenaya hassleriana]